MSGTIYAKRLDGIYMPSAIADLKVHPEFKLPLPWFCQQEPPDFRVADARKLFKAHQEGLCWICGRQRYEKRLCFVVGPMCVITRTSSEPPSHRACAEFAAQVCPFMVNPRMRRNEKDMPEGATDPAGTFIKRNPGVSATLTTMKYEIFTDGFGGTLFQMGEPLSVKWWAEGREATRAEVEASLKNGMPALNDIAAQESPEAVVSLSRNVQAFIKWLPVE